MSALSDYLENKILNHILRKEVYTPPDTLYVALFTGDPTDAAVGPEVNAPSYARQAIAFNAAVNGSSANTSIVNFPVSVEQWGNVSHVGIYDAALGGNMLLHAKLDLPKQIDISDQFFIRAGNWIATID